MMTSSRSAGDFGGFATRRGHTSQLSISDPSHHVTEAIGTLYGDEDDDASDGVRPLSFIGDSAYQDQNPRPALQQDQHLEGPRRRLSRSQSDQLPTVASSGVEHGSLKKAQTAPMRALSTQGHSHHSADGGPRSPISPTPSLRDVKADPSGSQFPLTNIDNPSDIAQELSNLQALRRMSMDVGSMTDPDMPPMTLSTIPSIAPSGDDDENDPSRLLWVPARVHPELAPSEFQTFLEKRVKSIRRRSGAGDSSLSPEGDMSRSNSGSSLKPDTLSRRKSMLSQQIDNSGGRGAVDYVDGAEVLERKRSRGHHARELSLDDLVKDPRQAVQKLAQESQDHAGGEEGSNEDKPILPMAPGGGLRRSTRTTYRKGGSLRSGDRAPFSRRVAHRQQDSESSDANIPSPPDAPKGHSLARVQSEPIGDNFSGPSRSLRKRETFSQEASGSYSHLGDYAQELADRGEPVSPPQSYQDELSVRRTTLPYHGGKPAEEPASWEENPGSQYYPQRSSSQTAASQQEQPLEALPEEPPPRSSRRTASQPVVTPIGQTTSQRSQPQQYTSRSSPPPQQTQGLNDALGAHSPLPGGGSNRTDMLTFIPTLNQEDRKTEKKSKKSRDDDASSMSSTKSSGSAWKWFKSGTDDKDKKKEEGKKSKTRSLVEKAQDNARLDVIQSSIDKTASKGRESLVLERDNVDSRLQEERKKESNRKSDSKKEKDGNIFSSIFGGSKKREEKEKSHKKSQYLRVSEEEPVYKPLQPDVDYNWTRFPLLEERAIYRMAHIKLANPRRSLLSQVLLSNFMYSYLAIVQAMHPQMNVPISPQQKRLEEEARRKQEKQGYMEQEDMDDGQDDQSNLDQYDFDYHRAAVQYADSGSNGQVDYVDDAQIYEDEHGDDHDDGYGYDGADSYGQGVKEYYQYHNNGDDQRHGGRDGMW